MPSTREMRLRISSVKNLAQVTRAQETVSASKVRRAVQSNQATRPYATKAWKTLIHLARQPGHQSLHPMLAERDIVRKILVLMITSDRGLAGAYNVNIVRHTLNEFNPSELPVIYVTVGRKGRDMLLRRRKVVLAEFAGMSATPSFLEAAPIGRLVVDEFLRGDADQVFIAYTEFENLLRQVPVIRKLLPLEVVYEESDEHKFEATHKSNAVFEYEPGQTELLNEIIPRFTGLQIYQALLSSQASEHAARMVAMRNATDAAKDLASALELEYNKIRQNLITNEMLDISGGAEALAKASAG
jgi:F-type H+-transporting ATPase subunit gamma